MNLLSRISQERLATCDIRLQNLVNEVSKAFAVRVLCGHRNKEEQDSAIKNKTSKTPWPKSKHNSLPSMAVDLLPEKLVATDGKIDWNNKAAFKELSEVMFTCAANFNIHLRWGGDFNMDGSRTNSDAWDLPHFEIVEKKA